MSFGFGRRDWARRKTLVYLTDTCLIIREVRVPDGAGGYTITETTTSVPCRLQTLTPTGAIGRQETAGGSITAITVWQAILPHGSDVRPTDKLLINGRRYEVVEQNDARTDAIVMTVDLRRIE